jgi:hypothetical protein
MIYIFIILNILVLLIIDSWGLGIGNSSTTNYTKYNHSKDNTQPSNNLPEKKKKSSSNKKSSNKKEKKNCIPKIKTDIINGQINNEINLENIINNNNVMNNNNTNTSGANNFKNKKEYVPGRHNSSHHQKSNDIYDKNSKEINILRKKILTGNGSSINSNNHNNGNNSNSNKYIPRANERLTSSDNNNNCSNNKVIKRSNTNNYNDSLNYNLSNEINKYKNTIKILLYYIDNLNKKIKSFFNKNQIEKNNKIKELSLQNKFLLNENKNLKIKILQFFYMMKIYIKNGNMLYNEKYHKLLKELILENKYLRGINILPKNINNDYLIKLKKQIQIEKMIKELLINNQFTNRNDNNLNNNNNLDNQNNNKDNNNPFIHNDNETSLNSLNNQVSHKRQRTHFNLGKLNEENNMNRDSIGSSHNLTSEQNSVSVNTVIDNKDKEKDKDKDKDKESPYYKNNKSNNNKSENIFCEALKEMSNYNKTLKKMNNNSKKNILENKNENNVNDCTKLNKYGNKMVNNIPYNVNKSEYGNIPNDKGDNRKNSKSDIKTNIKNNNSINNYVNDKLNENENSKNKKQQSIYYRAAKEKEKKKIEFTK